MTTLDLSLILTAVILMTIYRWLFRVLPRERWQFLATIPIRKLPSDYWRGINLTLYGFFTALAGVISCATFLALTSAINVASSIALLLILAVLAACLPAAKLIARIVEKNPHGFTVGGASFVGIILAPFLLLAADALSEKFYGASLPAIAILAAISIAYVAGEGIGRLACLSFGCCYGKPVTQAPLWIQRACAHAPHRYSGKTKKICFAGNMENVSVIPIQSATCVAFTLLALTSISLFFHNQFTAALLVSLLGSQGWRLGSEVLRADFRGGKRKEAHSGEIEQENGGQDETRFSIYQIMTVVASIYIVGALYWLMPTEQNITAIAQQSLNALWQPEVIVSLQAIGLIMFFYSGTSTITRARIQFSMAPDWQQQTELGSQNFGTTTCVTTGVTTGVTTRVTTG
jgi:prolipoprotein diacylglyceryl transferase